MGTDPWVLARQPTYWRDTAMLFAHAEGLAQKDRARRNGRGKGGGYKR